MRSAYQKMKDSSNSLRNKLWHEAELKKSQTNCFLANIAVLNVSQKDDIGLLAGADENWNLAQSLHSLRFFIFVIIARKKRTFESLLNSIADGIDTQVLIPSGVNRMFSTYYSGHMHLTPRSQQNGLLPGSLQINASKMINIKRSE